MEKEGIKPTLTNEDKSNSLLGAIIFFAETSGLCWNLLQTQFGSKLLPSAKHARSIL